MLGMVVGYVSISFILFILTFLKIAYTCQALSWELGYKFVQERHSSCHHCNKLGMTDHTQVEPLHFKQKKTPLNSYGVKTLEPESDTCAVGGNWEDSWAKWS